MNVSQVEVLYSSNVVRSRLSRILANPSPADLRIVFAACVADSTQASLPNPRGAISIVFRQINILPSAHAPPLIE